MRGMKYLALFAFIASFAIAAENVRVAGWQETQGMTEAEAVKLTRAGIIKFLTWDDEGEYCTADDFWSFEYDEAHVMSGEPAFAVTAYARGPYDQCAGETTYDCRVVFIKNSQGKWTEDFTDCEPTSLHDGD